MTKSINLICLLTIALLGCSSSADVTSPNTSPQPTKASDTQGQILPIGATTVIGGETIELEVAATPQQQQLGLMYRDSLADNRGMLFTFTPPREVRFWMKNVTINLDMIFLHNGIVQAIESQVPPCLQDICPVYGPANTVIDRVIELRGGRASELGLQPGDRLQINFLNPAENLFNPKP